jgi:outer membrane protein TolC
MRVHNIAVVAAVVCCAAASWAAEPRRLTVEEAVELALAHNPQLKAATLRQRGSHDAALAVGARLLPSIHVSEEYQHFNEPFSITFMPGASFQARDQDTNTFVLTADQPLVGLGHVAEDYVAQRDAAAANQAGVTAARAQLVESVRVGFLRYFESQAMAEVARASERELAEQIKVAQAKVKAGVLTNADLLRVEVAQANTRQQEILAESQAQVARANLLAAIGLDPADPAIALVEPASLLTPAGPLPADQAAAEVALRKRPEIARGKLAATSAAHTRTARYLSLLPEIDGEAGYVRLDGQPFAAPESWYVGVRASWAVWEWGASFFAARAAGTQAAAAQADLESQRNQVSTEVQSALAQSRAAAAAVDVAQKTIASAQEAYRVTDALVKAGAATTTDLLDAQAALTTARLNLARARYELAIQRVDLARVMGQ